MSWWYALTLDLQVFYALGILATGLLVIQLIMTILGAGHEGVDGAVGMQAGDGLAGVDGLAGADGMGLGHALPGAGPDLEHASGLGLVSTRSVIAFVAGFGWTGAMARHAGWAMVPSVAAALVVGFALMFMVYWLMRWLYSLRESGSLDYRNAIGATGTVYVTIPAAGLGSGQIQVLVQSRLATVAAANAGPQPIASGRPVKVIRLLAGNTLLVEAL
jgi:hypothetical protein